MEKLILICVEENISIQTNTSNYNSLKSVICELEKLTDRSWSVTTSEKISFQNKN